MISSLEDLKIGTEDDPTSPVDEPTTLEPKQPTVLQRLRFYKHNHTNVPKSKDLRRQIKESLIQAKFAKAGQKLEFRDHSVDESIAWALAYAHNHKDSLQSELFSLIDDVVKYETHKKAAGNMGNTAKGLETKSPAKHPRGDKSGYKVPNAVTAASIAQQLDKRSAEGLETFMLAQFQVARRRSRSTKVEFDHNRKLNVKSSILASVSEGTSCGTEDKDVTQSSRRRSITSSTEVVPVKYEAPVPPSSAKPSSSSIRAGGINREATNVEPRSANLLGSTDTATSPAAQATLANDGTASVTGGLRVFDSVNAESITDDDNELKAPKTKLVSTVDVAPLPDEPTISPRIDPKKITAVEKQPVRDSEKEFERILKAARHELEHITQKMNALQGSVDRRIRKGVKYAERVLSVWQDFEAIWDESERKSDRISIEKEFLRQMEVKRKLHNFAASDRGNLSMSVREELERMNHLSKQQIKAQQMDRIVAATWFTNFLPKLQEFSRRSATPVPICCFQFLVVMKFFLMFDLKLTADLFYKTLENTVESDDHSKLVVHRTLKAAREAIGIGPEAFVNYLDSKGIAPYVDLLAQVRIIRQKRAVKVKAAQSRISASEAVGGLLGSPISPRRTITMTFSRQTSFSSDVSASASIVSIPEINGIGGLDDDVEDPSGENAADDEI